MQMMYKNEWMQWYTNTNEGKHKRMQTIMNAMRYKHEWIQWDANDNECNKIQTQMNAIRCKR